MTTAAANHEERDKWWRSLPVLQGLLPLDKAQLGPGIIAGITLAVLGIPEVMGYTKIIGTPIITALFKGGHSAQNRVNERKRDLPPMERLPNQSQLG